MTGRARLVPCPGPAAGTSGGGRPTLVPLLLLALLLAGCAPLTQNPTAGRADRKMQEADSARAEGRYEEARTAYLALADGKQTDPSLAEQARYYAASVLVRPDNPARDFALAAREFEELKRRYPEGLLAGEAGSWLDALAKLDQERLRTDELQKEVASLTERLEVTQRALQEANKELQTAISERDLVGTERAELDKQLGERLTENARLALENDELTKRSDDLSKEKAVLESKIAALTLEKKELVRAKEKLEKSLRDLTMVDVKMEKKRKKMKKDDKN